MQATSARMLLAVTVLLLAPSPAHAFKIDTHVWVGQQVLNDLWPDCRLTIGTFGDFEVDAGVCAMLKANPSAYRMGSIGPDGFPDLVGGQMTTHPGLADQPGGWTTDEWLRFVMRRAAASKPADRAAAYAFSLGYLTHAASDVFSHTYVNSYAGDIFSLMDGEVDVELRHMKLEDFIRARTPPLVDEAGVTFEARERLDLPSIFVRDFAILNPEVAEQYRLGGATTAHLAAMYEVWAQLDRLLAETEAALVTVTKALTDAQGKLDDAQRSIDRLTAFLTIDPCAGNPTPCPIPLAVTCAVLGLDPTIASACITLGTLQLSLTSLRATLEAAKLTNRLTVEGAVLPIRAWKAEIEWAIEDYVVTSRKVSIELMTPGGKPTEPLLDWACLHAASFAAVPSVLNMPLCATIDVVGNISTGVATAREAISKNLGLFGWLVDPLQKVDEIINTEIKPVIEAKGLEVMGNVTGEDSLMFLIASFRLERISETALTDQFAADASSKGLLLIPDIVARVHGEMHKTAAGTFDPEAYAVVRNSIILSKLVLLGPAELNRLARGAGVQESAYGPNLYSPTDPFNLLLGSVLSIDGNHQWQETAPPYPRRGGDSDYPDKRHYGRGFPEGFRFWQDCLANKEVFQKLFTGPLVPGIERPADLGLAPPDAASPSGGYVPEYPPTLAMPFPLSGGSTIWDLAAPWPAGGPLTTLVGECGLSVAPPAAVDNCADTGLTVTTTDPTVFNSPGSYQINWTFNDHVANARNDNLGNWAVRPLQVQIIDTTPPQLTIPDPGPYCARAPAGDWAVVRLDADLHVTATDPCDPAAAALFTGAVRLERRKDHDGKDHEDGDHHREGRDDDDDDLAPTPADADVVVFPDHVCLRIDRHEDHTRRYALSLAARDSTGNTSASSQVVVRLRAGEVEEEDSKDGDRKDDGTGGKDHGKDGRSTGDSHGGADASSLAASDDGHGGGHHDDRRHCRRLTGLLGALDGDPRCVAPPPPTVARAASSAPTSAGSITARPMSCSTGSTGGALALLVLLLVLVPLRSRPRRAAGRAG
jgi:hypothetical protein